MGVRSSWESLLAGLCEFVIGVEHDALLVKGCSGFGMDVVIGI